MASVDDVRSTVAAVVWRLRFSRIFVELLRVGIWCVGALLLAVLVHRIVLPLPTFLFLAVIAATTVLFAVQAVRAAASVTLTETAKVIDDELGLKDRLTSSLYFSSAGSPEPMMLAAVADAAALVPALDTSRVTRIHWPRTTLPFLLCLLLLPVVWLGPVGLRKLWTGVAGSVAGSSQTAHSATSGQSGTVPVAPEDSGLTRIDSTDKTKDLQKLASGSEAPPSEESDYTHATTQETQLSQEDLDKISKLTAKELDELTKAFTEKEKDDAKKKREEENKQPLKLAPLDNELIQDIIASDKKKAKDEGGKDQGTPLAIPIKSSEPGPASKGPRTRGGGHGGGDVGESGDTRIPPRRVEIAGRAKILIESMRSADNVDKQDTPRVVMTPLMMKVSTEGVTVTASSQAANPRFSRLDPERISSENIPLGMRRYVQRYFEWVEHSDRTSAGSGSTDGQKETQ